jgi:HEAT repeat protein
LPRPVVTTAAPEKPVEAPAAFEEASGKAPHDPVPELILALKKGSAVSRARAADELGSLRGAAAPAVPSLLASLKDRSPRVRASASLALGNIGVEDPSVIPLLEKALKDKNLDVRYAAALALSRAGTPEARAAFKKRLNEDGRREIDQ